MAKVKELTVVLVGPNAGANGDLAGFTFKDGKTTLLGTEAQLEPALNLLGNFYNAHPEGSDEHKKAVAAWEKATGGPSRAPVTAEAPKPPAADERRAELESELERARAELRAAKAAQQAAEAKLATAAQPPAEEPQKDGAKAGRASRKAQAE